MSGSLSPDRALLLQSGQVKPEGEEELRYLAIFSAMSALGLGAACVSELKAHTIRQIASLNEKQFHLSLMLVPTPAVNESLVRAAQSKKKTSTYGIPVCVPSVFDNSY